MFFDYCSVIITIQNHCQKLTEQWSRSGQAVVEEWPNVSVAEERSSSGWCRCSVVEERTRSGQAVVVERLSSCH